MSAAMSAPGEAVSIREFARLDGCDEALVRRAIKRGKLPVSDGNKIDPALAGSEWRTNNRRADTGADKGAKSAPKVSAPRLQPTSADALAGDLEGAIDALLEGGADDFLAAVVQGQFVSYVRAEQIKENGLAAKHLLAARKDAGQLVEVERAEAVLFEAARAARDAWLRFPTRIGPLLAADLNVDADRVVEALTAHVQDQLEELGEPDPDFTGQRE